MSALTASPNVPLLSPSDERTVVRPYLPWLLERLWGVGFLDTVPSWFFSSIMSCLSPVLPLVFGFIGVFCRFLSLCPFCLFPSPLGSLAPSTARVSTGRWREFPAWKSKVLPERPPALPHRENPPGRPCRGATNNRTPHLGPIMEQSAVFMQQCFQSVNNIGDLRKFCHKEAFLSLNKWKHRDPHALQKLTPGSSGRHPGENQGYTMEGGVSAATEMQETS